MAAEELQIVKPYHQTNRFSLYDGDCRSVLPIFAECSVDSIVCDPPYELGFMGKGWDRSGIAYDVSVWRECLRVLKPGGHLLAFGGSRTYHRLACAIEDAGFEIRDQIMWLYGQGFPKSKDVSKAIDSYLGVEPKVIGTRPAIPGVAFEQSTPYSTGRTAISVTTGATWAAKHWDGYGTALKPAHEPAVLARKPTVGTVAENVLIHGTGGLNIAACRVKSYDQQPDAGAYTPQSQNGVLVDTSASVLSFLQDGFQRIAFALRSCNTDGIAPSHGEGDQGGKSLAGAEYESLRTRLYPNGVWCGLTLTSTQDSPACCPSCRRSCDALFHRVQERARESAASLADALVDICRELPALVHNHECQSSARPSSCDVASLFAAFLSRLSGSIIPDIQPSRAADFGRWPANVIHDGSDEVLAGFPNTVEGGEGLAKRETRGYEGGWGDRAVFQYADSGSAARFFYCAKATQDDRNEGCQDLPHRVADDVHKRPRTELDDPRRHGVTPRQNNHPTVKPTDLMRYLCRLVTPPGGLVLDPFCGSGSTGKAAMLEGLQFIGIELSADYCQLAQRRIEAATKQGLLFT